MMTYNTIFRREKGSSHKICEDKYLLAKREHRLLLICADGHGGDCYTRAGLGARFACCAASKVLSGNYDAEQSVSLIKDTYDNMVSKHLAHHPLEWWELKKIGDLPQTDAYGTTLMAAVLTPDYTEIYQIGDGEIHLLSNEGALLLPLQADLSCIGNFSSSLALDKDRVTAAFRSARYESAAVCFMFSDGCEGGMLDSLELLSQDMSEWDDALREIFRKTERGDDQTFLLAYNPDILLGESFNIGVLKTIATTKEENRAKKERAKNIEEYLCLREYLKLAMPIAVTMQHENDPKLEAFLEKLHKSYERLKTLKAILNPT